MSSLPVLVLNSGSSSIKFSVYEAGGNARTKLFEGAVDGIGTDLGKFWIKDATGKKLVDQTPALPNRAVAFQLVADALHSGSFPVPAAIGHRTVCGGPTIKENQIITPQLIDEIESYAALAPLHTPIGVYIMREALRLFPGIPNFAVLDSYFHRTMPEVVTHMPIPSEFCAMGVRRYGYHGISYESIVYQLQPHVPERLIVAHLGNGASISAIFNGQCLDTSMGLTPTGGILSGTRTGDIDPGVLIFMLRKFAESTQDATTVIDRLEAAVGKKAGLLGVSELSNDMRDLREAIDAGNQKARMAVDKFNWTIAKWIGGFVAELGGLDMLVFTGGIGENDIATRREICSSLGALGIQLDPARNNVRGEAVISAENSAVTVRVIPPARGSDDCESCCEDDGGNRLGCSCRGFRRLRRSHTQELFESRGRLCFRKHEPGKQQPRILPPIASPAHSTRMNGTDGRQETDCFVGSADATVTRQLRQGITFLRRRTSEAAKQAPAGGQLSRERSRPAMQFHLYREARIVVRMPRHRSQIAGQGSLQKEGHWPVPLLMNISGVMAYQHVRVHVRSVLLVGAGICVGEVASQDFSVAQHRQPIPLHRACRKMCIPEAFHLVSSSSGSLLRPGNLN